MVTIATVLKYGGPYYAEYLVSMRRQLRKFWPSDVKWRLVCLTDRPWEVSTLADPIRLKHGWPGWWSKIELFRKELFQGCVVYFDLDTLVLRQIQDFVQICQKAKKPMAFTGRSKVAFANGYPASGILTWQGGELVRIYDRFVAAGPDEVMQALADEEEGKGQQGDQGWIRRYAEFERFERVLPSLYAGFKRDWKKQPEKVWGRSCILNWSGEPRLHDPANPAHRIWTGEETARDLWKRWL